MIHTLFTRRKIVLPVILGIAGQSLTAAPADTSSFGANIGWIILFAITEIFLAFMLIYMYRQNRKNASRLLKETLPSEHGQEKIQAEREQWSKERENLIREKEATRESALRELEQEKARLGTEWREKLRENEQSLQEALIRQQEAETRLQEAEQLHSSFFTYTVHEMRTPLSLIVGILSELIQNKEMDSDTATQLLAAYRNSLALEDLADQLIDTRHASTISKHLRIARYDIVNITKQICDLFVDWIAMNKIEFRLSAEHPALWIWLDRRKMEYSLRMLLSNSFQNTYLYGKISVDISIRKIDGKGYCCVTVQDDGLNENESTRRGLKQIADMADDLGGRFEHEETREDDSKIGATRYQLYIPLGKMHLLDKTVEFVEPEGDLVKLNDIQKEEIAELIQITSEKKQTGKKLLVVDDNVQIRWFLKHIFSSEYQILEARDGQEGIDTALKEEPNIILCDVMMPGKDGFEVCKELKTNPKTFQTPIIMLTAKVESEDVIAGIENGADDYITKPFDVEILRSKVKNLLIRREQLKQYFTRSLLATDLSAGNAAPQENAPIPAADNAFIDSVVKCIEKHINNPKFEAKILADELFMSLPTLYRKIKQYSDYSILELTRIVRLKKAAELIRTQKYSIQEVSEMVGFNDTATFRKRFTEQFGVTPSAYGR